ncbi:MAG: hypothetical protein DRP22_04720, partial [Verrucomicrobia bacterium]
LEALEEKVPRTESFGRKRSKAAPTSVGASLAPILIGAGVEACRQKVPRIGNFEKKISEHWKFCKGKVPRFGSFGGKSSKVWKFCRKKFQALEVLGKKVPSVGIFGRKSFKHWKSAEGNGPELAPLQRRLAPQRCLSRRMRE